MEKKALTEQAEYKFNFTDSIKAGYTSVVFNTDNGGAPLYSSAAGCGFVSQTCAMPPREVHTGRITSDGSGFVICEPSAYAEAGFENDNYNNYGMAFRIKAPAGAYKIFVTTTSEEEDTTVSVSGMHGQRILQPGYWDAASLIPVRNLAETSGRNWSYTFVNGREFIDIEIEPKRPNTPVGLQEIVLVPLKNEARPEGVLPTVYTLGDSTMKTYTFDESPMSGWGQVFDDLFDLSQVHVVNYSMGGRSFKNTYWEGRLNDILLAGYPGDYILIQFGHNDESLDEYRRYGRGNLESSYEMYIREVYLPAIQARGLIPVLITPMSRINVNTPVGQPFVNSFNGRVFPDVMRRAAAELGITLIDLNAESVRYYNETGVEAAIAMFMSIEAGETPGKTNDGSYANGHPSNKIDGTHYKEALAKQFARIVATEIFKAGMAGNPVAGGIAQYLKPAVKAAIEANDWSALHPELTSDTTTGPGSYYRHQIEKLLQLGVLSKDAQGRFHPDDLISTEEFITALGRLMDLEPSVLTGYEPGSLSRERMGAILLTAYQARFTDKPRYMTDYNGSTVIPGDPGYDPNLDSGAKGTMYYPLVSYSQLTDTDDIAPDLRASVKAAYELGLIRSEKGIVRGRMVNGVELEPRKLVTRAKAAKTLYYMWVLSQPVKAENDVSSLKA
jgi:lysophospholipase L1-like esterase